MGLLNEHRYRTGNTKGGRVPSGPIGREREMVSTVGDPGVQSKEEV